MIVTHDPDGHGYAIDGRPAPGIHEIAESLNLIEGSQFYPKDKTDFGTNAHIAFDLHFKGRLDRSTAGAYLPYVDAAQQAVDERKIHIRETEKLVANKELHYATKVDAVALWQLFETVINFKTGLLTSFHDLQAAAERLCFPPRTVSLYVYLHPDEPGRDGKPYTLQPYNNDHGSEEDWRAACRLYNRQCKTTQSVRPRGAKPEKTEEITLPVRTAESLFEPEATETLEDPIFPWVDEDPISG